MTFGQRLKRLRLTQGWSQEELAQVLGSTKQVISRYETGERSPKLSTLEDFARALHMPLSLLIGDGGARQVPLLGTIACGLPLLAEEQIERYVPLPDGVDADFCLRCRGDSMIGARILDGDIVFIRQTDRVEDGAIAAVLIGEEATLKRVYVLGSRHLVLRAENPAYPPLTFKADAFADIRLLGRAVGFWSGQV